MNKRIQTVLKLSLALGLSVSWGACNRAEQILESRASQIQKGMRIEEVFKILGSPRFAAIIESSEITAGWESWEEPWKTSHEELRKHDRVLFYNYHKGVVDFNVYFDLEQQKVVYVSTYFSAE